MSMPFATVKNGSTLDATLTASELMQGYFRTDPMILRRTNSRVLRTGPGTWLAPWPVHIVHKFGIPVGGYATDGTIIRTPDYAGVDGDYLNADVTAGWGEELPLLNSVTWTGSNQWNYDVRQCQIDISSAPITQLMVGHALRWTATGERGYVLGQTDDVITVALLSHSVSQNAPEGPLSLWKPTSGLKYLTQTMANRIEALGAKVAQSYDEQVPALIQGLTRILNEYRVPDVLLYGGEQHGDIGSGADTRIPDAGSPTDVTGLSNRLAVLEAEFANFQNYRQVPAAGNAKQVLAKSDNNANVIWRTLSNLFADRSITLSKLAQAIQDRLLPTGTGGDKIAVKNSSNVWILEDKPSGGGGEENVQSDWNETDNTQDDFIKNKPTIPAAQVNSDWDSTSGKSEILNKPTIPAAQVNSDWNATTGKAEILNKPTIPAAFSVDNNSLTPNNGDLITWLASGSKWVRTRFATLHEVLKSLYVERTDLEGHENDQYASYVNALFGGNYFPGNFCFFNQATQPTNDTNAVGWPYLTSGSGAIVWGDLRDDSNPDAGFTPETLDATDFPSGKVIHISPWHPYLQNGHVKVTLTSNATLVGTGNAQHLWATASWEVVGSLSGDTNSDYFRWSEIAPSTLKIKLPSTDIVNAPWLNQTGDNPDITDEVSGHVPLIGLEDGKLKQYDEQLLKAHLLNPNTLQLTGNYSQIASLPNTGGKVLFASAGNSASRNLNITWANVVDEDLLESWLVVDREITFTRGNASYKVRINDSAVNKNTIAFGGFGFNVREVSGTLPTGTTAFDSITVHKSIVEFDDVVETVRDSDNADDEHVPSELAVRTALDDLVYVEPHGTNDPDKVRYMTKSSYTSLSTKDSDTIYLTY